MAELNPIPPPPPLILPSATPSAAPPTTTTTTASPPPIIQQPLSNNPPPNITNNNPSTAHLGSQTLAPKRQRRPSVRLGDIGGEPTLDHSNFRRPKTSWRFHKDPIALKTSKTRPLTNLVNNKNASFLDRFDFAVSSDHGEPSNPNADLSYKKPKSKKPIKRPRSNWTTSAAAATSNVGLGVSGFENDVDLGDGNGDNDNDLLGFEGEGYEGLVRHHEQSPVNSRESLEFRDRRQISGARVSESSRGHHEMNGVEHYSRDEFRSSSVKDWLIGLGLGRYAPVFEIHEVDDEVLPMLTMEDLKDMGINAVGSRRKMYTAIEKFQKEFL